jgi:hypothetical protein
MITRCGPEMERMWARPESRIAWFSSSEMPPRSPVMSATAISPVSPDSAPLMRALTLALSASTDAQAAKSHGGGRASYRALILLVA